jgi:hypothetical protein
MPLNLNTYCYLIRECCGQNMQLVKNDVMDTDGQYTHVLEAGWRYLPKNCSLNPERFPKVNSFIFRRSKISIGLNIVFIGRIIRFFLKRCRLLWALASLRMSNHMATGPSREQQHVPAVSLNVFYFRTAEIVLKVM